MKAIIPSRKTGRAIVVLVGAMALARIGVADDLQPKADIHFGDLNLQSATGAKILYERIVRASYEICQHFDSDARYNADPQGARACRKKVIAEAVVKIGRASLYAVYHDRNATALPAPIVTASGQR